MNANPHPSGVRFLRLLGHQAEPIMDAYLSGSVADQALEPGVRDSLVKHGVLYRPEPGADLHLRRTVRALLEEALRDDRNRQIDANTGAALLTFKTLANHYREAHHQGDYAAADVYLADLKEHVYAFGEALIHAIRVLWSRINNEFGYVGTLNARIRENELAQSQVSDLLTGLELVRFEELAESAGDLRELRHLLVTNLQRTIGAAVQELSLAQSRLLELLGRFRQIRGRTRLLKGWLLHVGQHPEYRVGPHAAGSAIPSLFNRAAPGLAPANPNIHDQTQESELLALLSRIRALHPRDPTVRSLADAPELTLTAPEEFDVESSPIRAAVDAYFCQVIDLGLPLSALDYRQGQALHWDAESWLYQVIGVYAGLPEEQKQCFELETLGEPHPLYSGNFIIRDLRLWLN
ncbi:phosphoenolpyruvate carboxylase [Thiocystis violascens]|uniref:Phosphoenolpyruvate carboxylase, type 1 n=1 Tax=Thiocystis violascens (strain ATCC 17096 / DSM 198 / 6111) TaxID=765911 RepID=I3YCL5_THIV6|nr:phosphoenolpyruvate carboxylase [Thiocystis violascens]AFL74733.1 Phosphoenolpyruvate carboxylase, type 1 [Thiocystis violascens DSM 198]